MASSASGSPSAIVWPWRSRTRQPSCIAIVNSAFETRQMPPPIAGTAHPLRSSMPQVNPRDAVAGPSARQKDSGRSGVRTAPWNAAAARRTLWRLPASSRGCAPARASGARTSKATASCGSGTMRSGVANPSFRSRTQRAKRNAARCATRARRSHSSGRAAWRSSIGVTTRPDAPAFAAVAGEARISGRRAELLEVPDPDPDPELSEGWARLSAAEAGSLGSRWASGKKMFCRP